MDFFFNLELIFVNFIVDPIHGIKYITRRRIRYNKDYFDITFSTNLRILLTLNPRKLMLTNSYGTTDLLRFQIFYIVRCIVGV